MTQSAPQTAARDWSLRLLSAGLSLLPVGGGADRKAPLRSLLPEDDSGRRVWGCWSRFPPDPPTIDYWFSKRPDAGIGVICGQVSAGLQVLDVDDESFAAWLAERIARLGPLGATWSVRTGSGKLHVYLRSSVPLGPGEHKLIDAQDGRKLADVRDEGSYVVAPPSVSAAGAYRTLLGAPEGILRVADARGVWHALAAAYAQNGHVAPSTGAVEVVGRSVQHFTRNVRSAALGEELARLRQLVAQVQSARARRAILEGAQPNEPPWHASDRSDLDWRVIKEAMQAGAGDWSDADFEAIWASFPIGDGCYRNLERPNHGADYLLGYTLPKARAAYQHERHQAEAAAGRNFVVVAARSINYDPEPVFELLIERTDVEPHKTYTVSLTPAELGNERSFILSVFKQAHWVMQLQGAHLSAQGFRQFLGVLSGIMEEITPPEGATEKGQLWTVVRKAIVDRLAGKEGRPTRPSEIRFGWRQDETAYVSSSALMAHLRQEMRHPPRPQAVWGVLEARGARAHFVRIGSSREEVWEIRSGALA
jgi:Bifunctional DNA primase/polymerase, N-terminal